MKEFAHLCTDDGPSLDAYMSDEYQGRGLHTGQSTGSSYVEHAEPVTLSSLDANLVKSISGINLLKY